MSKILCLCIFWLAPVFLSASPAPKLQIACLQKCHAAYCARAKKAFYESERLVFKDFVQSRWEYEQGCIYLQRASCVMRQMELLQTQCHCHECHCHECHCHECHRYGN